MPMVNITQVPRISILRKTRPGKLLLPLFKISVTPFAYIDGAGRRVDGRIE